MKEADLALQTFQRKQYSPSKSINPKKSSELLKNIKLSKAPSISFSPPRFNGSLYSYQRSSVAYCLKNKRVIAAEPTGTGKTFIACATLCAAESLPVVIVAPKSLVPVWKQEVQKLASQVFNTVQVVDSVDERVGRADITVLSYGMLSYDNSQNGGRLTKRLCDIGAEMFIADEAHALRGDSLRSRAAERICENSKYRLLLTGTPIVRDDKDIDRLLSILNQDVPQPENYRPLNREMRARCYIRHKRDVVLSSLPDRIRNSVRVNIDNRERYENIRKIYRHELTEAAGFKALYKFRKTAALGKIWYIKQLIDDLEDPAVIFAIHRDVQQRLLEEFPNAKKVTADLDGKSRQKQVEEFQSGNSDVIICAIGSTPEQSPGGVGIELTRASHGIFTELGWTHAHMVQAANRIHRLGQEDPVKLWFPIGENTIDEKVWDLIQERKLLTEKCTEGDIPVSEIANKLK